MHLQVQKQEWKRLFAPGIKHGDVLHSANMAAIANVLKVCMRSGCACMSVADCVAQEVEIEDEDEAGGKGARQWKPQVHYAWDVLLDELLPAEGSGKTPKGSFQEFFRIVVDGTHSTFHPYTHYLIPSHLQNRYSLHLRPTGGNTGASRSCGKHYRAYKARTCLCSSPGTSCGRG